MVIREWRGRAGLDKAAEYPRHFRNKVLPELRTIAGFRGAQLSRRRIEDQIEFLVLTRWSSFDAILLFAGEESEKAVVEPGAAAVLVSFDSYVRHYEVLEEEEFS